MWGRMSSLSNPMAPVTNGKTPAIRRRAIKDPKPPSMTASNPRPSYRNRSCGSIMDRKLSSHGWKNWLDTVKSTANPTTMPMMKQVVNRGSMALKRSMAANASSMVNAMTL